MKIILHAQRAKTNDTPPVVEGDTITYRGLPYDLSPIEEGDLYDAGVPFAAPVTRMNGELVVRLQYHYSTDTAEFNQPTNWDAYTFTVTSGQCSCPIVRKPAEEIQDVSAI